MFRPKVGQVLSRSLVDVGKPGSAGVGFPYAPVDGLDIPNPAEHGRQEQRLLDGVAFVLPLHQNLSESRPAGLARMNRKLCRGTA